MGGGYCCIPFVAIEPAESSLDEDGEGVIAAFPLLP